LDETGSFGATLTRALTKAGERVVEVNRPNRLARRMDGKSDRLDAEQIARAVLSQTSTAIPKAKSGTVEVIRTLRVTRTSAVKARTQAFNTLWGVMIGAPSPLRDELVVLTKRQSNSHSPRQTADWGRSSADRCSAVPPTTRRRGRIDRHRY
jgi:transposase